MRHARHLLYCCLLPITLSTGCASFWDEVTSRDFKFKNLYTAKPPPLVVLKESDDCRERACAMAALREPLQNGGTQQEQDYYLEILSKSAVSDRDPLCRIGAIKALGHFRDPRAADVLCSVTEQDLSAFSSDFKHLIRLEAIRSLAETGQPVAVKRLIDVAREPPVEGSDSQKQEVLDRRLAAIRGLGKYNYPESNETLVTILARDDDPAIRNRTHASLMSATGKDFPPDAQEWAYYLHPEMCRPNEDVARQRPQGPNNLWDYVTYPIRLVRGE